jgi:hypothetical protein
MHWLMGILQILYVFFVHNPKKFVEFQKLVDLLNMKGNKFFRKVKMRWISILSSTKQIYIKYLPLILKMHINNAKNDFGFKILNVLCDIDSFMGSLVSFLFKKKWICWPKLHKNIYIFVFYFVDFVKLAQYELYKFDCNPYAKFLNSTFEYYNYIKVWPITPSLQKIKVFQMV